MSESGAPSPPELVTLEHVVETPENVVLTFKLAGPAARVGAFFIDFVIRFSIFVVSSFVLAMTIGTRLPSLSSAVILVLILLLDWFYYAICEGFFRGQTPGKRMFGLRVIHVAGYPISLWEAVLRNFVRAMDYNPLVISFFGTYGVAWVTMLMCGRFQRLGDLVAQTVVIEERRVRVPREPIILSKIQPLPRGELGGWTPPPSTMSLIEEFLGRRGALTYDRGHQMTIGLARVLARRLDFRGAQTLVEDYPMAFIARVYATFHPVDSETILGPEDEVSSNFRTASRSPAEIAT